MVQAYVRIAKPLANERFGCFRRQYRPRKWLGEKDGILDRYLDFHRVFSSQFVTFRLLLHMRSGDMRLVVNTVRVEGKIHRFHDEYVSIHPTDGVTLIEHQGGRRVRPSIDINRTPRIGLFEGL